MVGDTNARVKSQIGFGVQRRVPLQVCVPERERGSGGERRSPFAASSARAAQRLHDRISVWGYGVAVLAVG